jgi:hypothetical protein
VNEKRLKRLKSPRDRRCRASVMSDTRSQTSDWNDGVRTRFDATGSAISRTACSVHIMQRVQALLNASSGPSLEGVREAAFRAPTTSTEWRQEPYILIIFVQSFGKRNHRLIALLIGSLWRWRCYRTRRLHSCSSNESVQRVQKSILHDSYRQLQDGMHVSRAQGSVVVTGREEERQIRTEA